MLLTDIPRFMKAAFGPDIDHNIDPRDLPPGKMWRLFAEQDKEILRKDLAHLDRLAAKHGAQVCYTRLREMIELMLAELEKKPLDRRVLAGFKKLKATILKIDRFHRSTSVLRLDRN